MKNINMKNINKYQQNKNRAREKAIKWQKTFSFANYSLIDLKQEVIYFNKTGKRYGLIKEFKENNII